MAIRNLLSFDLVIKWSHDKFSPPWPEDGDCLGWRGGPNLEYIWLKYSEVEERARAFGAGLASLGIEPGQDSYVGIYCHNTPEVRRDAARLMWRTYMYQDIVYMGKTIL